MLEQKSRQWGRLRDPGSHPHVDPRIEPRLLAALVEHGFHGPAGLPPATRRSSLDAVLECVGGQHDGFSSLYGALPDTRIDHGVKVVDTTEVITGIDGNQIELRIYRPVVESGALPCVLYIHGGGMVILDSFNTVHRRWCEDLAATGLLVVAVDFRNAYRPDGHDPFPAGLHDCASALNWIVEHRDALGVTKLVLQGESGGANLAIATTLHAKRTVNLDAIAGVFATVPYVSGAYGVWDDERKLRELPSLYENDTYFMNCQSLDLLVAAYDPTGVHAEDPLCWPYFATVDDLRGLPPHAIVVNELDPLRDEGIAFYHQLLAAGVSATGRVNLGLTHAAEFLFHEALPRWYRASIDEIHDFVEAV